MPRAEGILELGTKHWNLLDLMWKKFWENLQNLNLFANIGTARRIKLEPSKFNFSVFCLFHKSGTLLVQYEEKRINKKPLNSIMFSVLWDMYCWLDTTNFKISNCFKYWLCVGRIIFLCIAILLHCNCSCIAWLGFGFRFRLPRPCLNNLEEKI